MFAPDVQNNRIVRCRLPAGGWIPVPGAYRLALAVPQRDHSLSGTRPNRGPEGAAACIHPYTQKPRTPQALRGKRQMRIAHDLRYPSTPILPTYSSTLPHRRAHPADLAETSDPPLGPAQPQDTSLSARNVNIPASTPACQYPATFNEQRLWSSRGDARVVDPILSESGGRGSWIAASGQRL